MDDLLSPIFAYANYWLAASSTGFAKPKDWQDWADVFIEQMDSPPLWVILLATAKTSEELGDITVDRCYQEECANPKDGLSFLNSILGYMYLLRNKTPDGLLQFLDEAAMAAIKCDTDRNSEKPYRIRCKLEEIIIFLEATKDFTTAERETQELFEPFERLALYQWGVLKSAVNIHQSPGYRTDNLWW